ncbi:MAG: hypothetical protein GX306_01825, partial [Clostridiales bacterium]|nr:hypothetical protein [Clostridiales bacterium]
MSKKNVLGLILFGFITTVGLFIGVDYMIDRGAKVGTEQNQYDITKEERSENSAEDNAALIAKVDPWLTANPTDTKQEKITRTSEGLENTKEAQTDISKQGEESQDKDTVSNETNISNENSETPSQGNGDNGANLSEAQKVDRNDNLVVDNITANEELEDITTASETIEEASANTLGKPILTAPELELIYN